MPDDKRQLSSAKREAIRRVIVDLFAGALFHDVGMRDICERAGVTPKTLYKHFGNKDALLICAIEPDMHRLTASMEAASLTGGGVAQRFSAVGRAFFRFYFSHVPIARIVFLNIPSAYFVSQPDFIQSDQLAVMKKLVVEGQKDGTIRGDMAADLLVEALAGIAMRTMFRLLTASTLPDPDQAAADFALLTGPLLIAPSSQPSDR
ncbi:MAG: TetR/AcrR family transcriptional regulator [Alphaproteobacteria bacterium]|nr:TetR/AcrR family transcriptional regulator [Alphaproteobacteria bacterium]MBO6627994.1 TetR/AcrR family transcriptional regulator [Alphaproteobacteria bacterium]MDF1625564.1 TetR/AcrR family transcriptional regulator [Parvibaculaceae bacterium]